MRMIIRSWLLPKMATRDYVRGILVDDGCLQAPPLVNSTQINTAEEAPVANGKGESRKHLLLCVAAPKNSIRHPYAAGLFQLRTTRHSFTNAVTASNHDTCNQYTGQQQEQRELHCGRDLHAIAVSTTLDCNDVWCVRGICAGERYVEPVLGLRRTRHWLGGRWGVQKDSDERVIYVYAARRISRQYDTSLLTFYLFTSFMNE